MSFKISKIFTIPIILLSFLFDTNYEFNNVNANVKNSPANKNDLDLYHGWVFHFYVMRQEKDLIWISQKH